MLRELEPSLRKLADLPLKSLSTKAREAETQGPKHRRRFSGIHADVLQGLGCGCQLRMLSEDKEMEEARKERSFSSRNRQGGTVWGARKLDFLGLVQSSWVVTESNRLQR